MYEALAAEELEAVQEGPAEAVVVGINRDFTYDVLARAPRRPSATAPASWPPTSTTPTRSPGGGLIPGAGSMVAAVAAAAGATPRWRASRPRPPPSWCGSASATGVMVGDRPSTDGAMADTLGWPSPSCSRASPRRWRRPGSRRSPTRRRRFVGADLGALVDPLVASLLHA
ncbi:MAG: hypothetical protein U0W40_20215 [Acidimicrobiia bacterium]